MLKEKTPNNIGWTSTRGFSDGYAGEPSGSVRLDLTGAYRHHHLAHLVHLVVHLHQLDLGDATDMERLRRRIGGSCHHPAPFQIRL
eukprot:COSAG02_NODE_18585_length_930_cov_8.995187_2_plen_85_part_01